MVALLEELSPASNNTQLTNVSRMPGNWPLYGSGGFWQAAAWACSQWNRTDDRCRLRRHKTLAKSAQWASKEWPQFRGTGAVARKSTQNGKITQPAAGGRNLGRGEPDSEKLHVMGITTALQLSLTNPTFIRKNFNVVLERTVRELNGESCISLEEAPPPKQQIVCSRSFGQRITTYEEMRRAVCQYAERAAEKLRGERQYCRHISTFIKTSPLRLMSRITVTWPRKN